MLPACRTEGEGFAIPTFDLVPGDVEGFMEALWEFQAAFHDCFARSELRAYFFDYMVGQCSTLERKSIEPMALQVEGGTIRGLQRFISEVHWDEEQMRWNYHQLVAEEMGDPDGILIFDETGFAKNPRKARRGRSGQRTMHGGAVAASLPASSWYRRQVSEGTKGPIAYACARHRVTLCKDGLPARTVWLVIKRTLGPEPSYAYAISNALASTPLSTVVWLSGLRWAVEQCFEEGKTELGMDHYEVRKYTGWHHHMLTTMLAHVFLWHLKLRLGKKSPSTDDIATAGAAGSRATSAHLCDCRCPRPGRLGATA